jgi:hypothetical protein
VKIEIRQKDWPSFEGRFDSKGLSTRMDAKRESHDHQKKEVLCCASTRTLICRKSLAGLEVWRNVSSRDGLSGKTRLTLKQDLKGRTVLTVVGDDDTRTSNDLPGLTLSVDFLYHRYKYKDLIKATHGKTGPLS